MDEKPGILARMNKLNNMMSEASGHVYGIINDMFRPDAVPYREPKNVDPDTIDDTVDCMLDRMEDFLFFLAELRKRL